MMRQTISAMVLVGGLLLVPRLGYATGFPVFDGALNMLGIQQQWQQLMQGLEQIRQTANQIQQIENQVKQVQGMYTQIEQAAKNLSRLDINNATDLLALTTFLENKLHQAEYIGYQAQAAVDQARGLYPRIQGVLTLEQQRVLTLQWAAMRRDAAQVAISTQAIRDAQARYQQQWATLISKAATAEGTLQIQQVQAQGQGVMGQQLIAIEQQLATMARERSMQAMEAASRTEMEQHALDNAMRPLDITYKGQGRLLPMPRTGRE